MAHGLSDYESVFYPYRLNETMSAYDTRLWPEMSLGDLLKKYRSIKEHLDFARSKEPNIKEKKGVYHEWVMYTHNIRDDLNLLAEEIRKRIAAGEELQ